MDPSWKSNNIDPPKDWVKKFYAKAPRGKFYSFFRVRDERTVAIVFGVSYVCIYFYPFLKPVWDDAVAIYKHPELFRWENMYKSTLTPEQRAEVREKGGKNVHRLSDLWK